MQKQLLGGLLALASTCASAATWTISNTSAVPGQTIQIVLSLGGDGITEAAEIDLAFDEARLTLPVTGGAIPGANVSGQCARSTSKTVTALIYSLGGVLPPGPSVVCNIPFTVRPNSRAGRIALRASSKACAASAGIVSCVVAEGWIDVLGNQQPMMLKPVAEETDTLSVLLRSTGPSVSELVGRDYREQGADAPLPGLRHGVLRVRAASTYAAAGDYLRRLERTPDSPEAKSERRVYVDFDTRESRVKAQEILAGDPAVESVKVFEVEPFGPLDESPSEKAKPTPAMAKAGPAGSQDFLDLLALSQAWTKAGGWGLVGILDNGLSTNHVQLKSFTGAGSVGGSVIAGGNFLPYFARNVGGRQQPVTNVEELQPSAVLYPIDEQCDTLDGVDDGWLHYNAAGHGTHVSGLIGANGLDGQSVRGACVNCGLASVKRTWVYCSLSTGVPKVLFGIHPDTDADGLEHLYKIGAWWST